MRGITRRWSAALVAGAALAGAVLPSAGAAAEEARVPVYRVVQEGLTPEQSKALAERAGVRDALREDGTFAYVDAAGTRVPSVVVGKGRDEDGRATVSEALDQRALARITTISPDEARDRAAALIRLPKAYEAEPLVGHTELEQADRKGGKRWTTELDTTVSYRLHLDGVPVIGPGAKARIAFGGDGSVLQLSHAIRDLEVAATAVVMTPDEARERCAQLYPREVEQGLPTLAYYAPPLTAQDASGRGSVELILPHYACQPADDRAEGDGLGGRLVPAIPDLAPQVALAAAGDGRQVKASADVKGGSGPYTFEWSSSTVALPTLDGSSKEVAYARGERSGKADEVVTVTVTDRNGLVATASALLPGGRGDASAASSGGGAGGDLASFGIEQTVDEWSCAQGSANGFRNVMQSRGHTKKFDWRGWSAFEKDFKKTSAGGWDSSYVDDVDAQWYTGHGNPSSFSFKSSTDDRWVVPSDARWGDNWNLEWMQLESCQVLRDTSGTLDHFDRWDEAFDRLHLLNGFHDNAQCNSGSGGRFASYLFPETFFGFELRPALTVRQAWASMAADLQPAGRRYRSMSPVGPGGVHNLNDHFWGQGSVGPDIPASQVTGWVSISGIS